MMKLRSEERCGAAVKRQNKAGMHMRVASKSRMYGKNWRKQWQRKQNRRREHIIKAYFFNLIITVRYSISVKSMPVYSMLRGHLYLVEP